jgi:hypothetical protein
MFKFLLLLLLLSSCCHKLSVRTAYLTEDSLASSHVGTPDPRRGCPLIGQQLIVSWCIPNGLWHGQELILNTTIRFRNREEWKKNVTCDRPIGTFIYEIQDEEFLEKKGILTYKIFLLEDGEVTEQWIHPLWQEQINLLKKPE